jgi:hypothetical protein
MHRTGTAMIQHLNIADPDEHDDIELMDLAERLFSSDTPVVELERICMRLAHCTSDNAQQLLERFRRSPRAGAVEWLDCALEEGAFHLLSPRNELEEHEFLILKVVEDVQETIIDLCIRRDEIDLERRKLRVRRAALAAVITSGEAAGDLLAEVDTELADIDAEVTDIDRRVRIEEAVVKQLRASITTPRYQAADPRMVRSIHLL